MTVMLAALTVATVNVPTRVLIVIDWPTWKPCVTKLPSSDPAARAMVVPVIVMFPVNDPTAAAAPITVFTIPPVGVTSVWPSVTRPTLTGRVGAIASRIT